MNTEQQLEMKQDLLDNLSLEVETVSELDNVSMLYKDTYRFKLVVDGQVISEEYME